MTRSALAVASLWLALAASACHHSGLGGAYDETRSTVELIVENQNYADVVVYVVVNGTPARVGDVTGNNTRRFTLDPSFFPSGEIRLIATPIGGSGRASSGPLNVGPGQSIHFTIAPVLRQSFATVR